MQITQETRQKLIQHLTAQLDALPFRALGAKKTKADILSGFADGIRIGVNECASLVEAMTEGDD